MPQRLFLVQRSSFVYAPSSSSSPAVGDELQPLKSLSFPSSSFSLLPSSSSSSSSALHFQWWWWRWWYPSTHLSDSPLLPFWKKRRRDGKMILFFFINVSTLHSCFWKRREHEKIERGRGRKKEKERNHTDSRCYITRVYSSASSALNRVVDSIRGMISSSNYFFGCGFG